MSAASAEIGVILGQVGTPQSLDRAEVRRYLKEFLSDRRVIEEPRWKWWPILNLIILQTRPQKKGKDYETIWNTERNESFLKTITRNQAEKLAARIPGGTRYCHTRRHTPPFLPCAPSRSGAELSAPILAPLRHRARAARRARSAKRLRRRRNPLRLEGVSLVTPAGFEPALPP